jgi:glycerate kinase
MSRRVLIVPDKFKGTLTAQEAAQAIAIGWLRSRPQDRLELLPMSDGGDGFGAVMGQSLAAKELRCETINAAHRRCAAKWWWELKTSTAIIETAAVIGLASLPPNKYHPFDLDTFGLAAVISAAKKRGAKACLMGIGGSATNDGGFGLARALGWQFLDSTGRPIERWIELERLTSIKRPQKSGWRKMEIRVAVDVQNRLLGPRGASRIYGPQKGLRKGDMPRAEACLSRLASVGRKFLGADFSRLPGTGAAGGLGFGLAAFLGATLEPGSDLFARQTHLSARLQETDLVITGEGAIDASSLMGKGVGRIAQECRKRGIPCIGLAGKATPSPAVKRAFDRVGSMTQLASPEATMGKPAYWLGRLSQSMAHELDQKA